jgi:hypothetical protein
MDTPFHEFQLRDADGSMHRYEVLPHPASEGQAILLQMLAVAAEPVGRLAASIFEGDTLKEALVSAQANAKEGEKASLLDVDAAALLGNIDLGRLGADVKTSILSMPMEKLGGDILKHTLRDGQKLSARVVFDAAYTRNYLEYLQAVWEVVQVNRFLPLSAMSGLVKGKA